jgi:Tfp pilus assembly protein PilF
MVLRRRGCFHDGTGVADCYVILGNYSILPPADSFPQAKTAANKALELDDSLAEANASLAFTHYQFDWDWLAAEQEFKRAIALNPKYATAHDWYAAYLLTMDRVAEADTEIERAQEVDPLSLLSRSVRRAIITSLAASTGRSKSAAKPWRSNRNSFRRTRTLVWRTSSRESLATRSLSFKVPVHSKTIRT